MRRLIAAILALSALSVGAAPWTVTWVNPTQWVDIDGTLKPLPADAVITRTNVYCRDGSIGPFTNVRTFTGSGTSAVTDFTAAQECAKTTVMTAPSLWVGERESDPGPTGVLGDPKPRPASSSAKPTATGPKPIECLPAGRVCVLP